MTNYKTAHAKVRRLRGPASEQFCVAGQCDLVASEWALNLERARVAGRVRLDGDLRYSEDPSDYDPLCTRCHRGDDGNPYSRWRLP